MKPALRTLLSLAGVAALTLASRSISVNATTVGFTYLLLILVIASTWGFRQAAITSVAAATAFNFFFLPPFGTFTIADPQNWVALFSFLATALIAGRLSAKAERRAQDAIARRQDVENLYAFSRAILLIEGGDPFPKQLVHKLAEIFPVSAAVLYDRRTDEIFRAGPSEFEGLEDQLRDASRHGSSYSDPQRSRVITAVRLGAEPIAALALQGAQMPDSVVQGIGNLVAIGLERARAQDLAHEVEASRRSEQLRKTLLDAMAHEFKTPLTSIKAATTALIATPDDSPATRLELLTVADEEAGHLQELIDDAVEMGRLDDARIELHVDLCSLREIIDETVALRLKDLDERKLQVLCEGDIALMALDRRLITLALKQLLDNALKYSPSQTPVTIRLCGNADAVVVEITDRGAGIPRDEQARVFERFYRGRSTKQQIPGSGLGLSIAASIVQAHQGELTVTSRTGETTFRMSLPVRREARLT